MNLFVVNPRTRAFTMVELLVVIAMIGILAAIILPVLNKGQQRGQRAFCENSLGQIGLAFHSFENDHSSKFPMAVSTNEGGSLEYVQQGLDSGGEFYTAFRSFLPLAGELTRPDALICPSDTARQAAANFFTFQNTNLSYFVGVNGNFDKPGTILAGDRNLATNSMESPTIMGIGLGSRLYWTFELHQYRGNVLFADGHVEEWNNDGLITGGNSLPDYENLFLPSVLGAANNQYYGSGGPGNNGGSGGPGSSSSSYAAGQNPAAPMSSQAWVQSPSRPAGQSPSQPMAGQPDSMSAYPVAVNNQPRAQPMPAAPNVSSTTTEANPTASPPVATATPAVDTDLAMSPLDRHLTKLLQHSFVWSYLLLLLLLLLYLIYRLGKWMQQKEAKQRPRERD